MTAAALVPALLRIPTELVDPGPNARGHLGDLSELQESIAEVGIIKPLIVSEVDGRYRVLDGARRLASAKALGIPEVLGVLRRDPDPRSRLVVQLAMNAHAQAFEPIAEAKAISELMFTHRMSREAIAASIGKSPAWVRDRLSLLNLNPRQQSAVESRELSVTKAVQAVREARSPAGRARKPRRGRGKHCRTCTCAAGVA